MRISHSFDDLIWWPCMFYNIQANSCLIRVLVHLYLATWRMKKMACLSLNKELCNSEMSVKPLLIVFFTGALWNRFQSCILLFRSSLKVLSALYNVSTDCFKCDRIVNYQNNNNSQTSHRLFFIVYAVNKHCIAFQVK